MPLTCRSAACSHRSGLAAPAPRNLTARKDAAQIGSFWLIDDGVQARIAGKFPGSAITIVDSGKLVYSKGYGIADLNSLELDKVPFIEDTVTDIASVLA